MKRQRETRVKGVFLGGDIYETSLRDYVNASYADLVHLLGEPNGEGDGYKVSTIWELTFEGHTVTLYDYKETNLYDDKSAPSVEEFRALPSYNWHLGGRRDLPVDKFKAAFNVALQGIGSGEIEPLPDAIGDALGRARKLTRSTKLLEALAEIEEEVEAIRRPVEELRQQLRDLREVDAANEKANGEFRRAAEEYTTDLIQALEAVVRDRAALLRRFGLIDSEWSEMGGACEADFEVRVPEGFVL